MMKRECLGHWILTPSGVVDGHVAVSGDRVAEVCHGPAPSGSARALVLPGFVNAHTHVADSVGFPAPRGTVEQLVAPPDGYKHRILRESSSEAKKDAMRAAVQTMLRSGTTAFADFREEGLLGVKNLKASLPASSPRAIILGRPESAAASDSEIDRLLEACDGIGMSAVSDWPFDFLKRLSSRARAKKKLFAIHASECVREDIDAVLALSPHFVVHMTKAADEDIEACAAHGVPIVVCPRSNEFYGLRPEIPRMLELGATVALGTDNGMICAPDLIEEMKAAYRICRGGRGLSPADAVHLATFGGRKVLNQMGKILTNASPDEDLVVVRVKGEDPLLELVTSAGSEDVLAVAKGGVVWRAESWRT